MASAELSWTAADSFVNQIEEYRIFRADKVGSAAIGPFAQVGTTVVERAFDGTITNPVAVLLFSDDTVNFGAEAYQYRVDAIPVLVGEAPSPQTAPGPSNIIGLGTQPSAPVLDGVEVSGDVVLTWTASTPALNPIDFYTVFRSVNGAAFVVIGTVQDPTLTFTDTNADLTDPNTNEYKVTASDEVGIESDDSNIVQFGFTNALIVVIDGGSSVDFQKVATSLDGITFELRATPTSGFLRDIAYSEELSLFCVVGDTGFVMISADGITWADQTTPSIQDWNSVAWSDTLMLFAAVSDEGTGDRVMTSPDGINWTLRTSAGDFAWQHIEWVPFLSLFVAIHNTNNTTTVMTSPDGLVWTIRTTPGLADQGDELAFSSSLIISNNAVDTDGYITSTDAIVWTQRDAADTHAFTGVAFGNGFFFRIDPFSGADDVWRNADPTSPGAWAQFNSQGANANDIKFAPLLDLFIIVSNTDEYTISTDNGATWAARQSFPNKLGVNGNWARSVEGTQLKIIVEQEMIMVENNAASPVAGRSVNGASWVDTATAFPFRLDDVAWSSPLQLYAAVGDGVCVTSPDGLVWTSRTVPSNDWQVVYWSDSLALFIAGALDSFTDDNLMTSVDGITWIQRTSPADLAVFSITSDGAGRIVAGGFTNFNPVDNNIFSDDGINWSQGSDPGQGINAMVYDTTRNRFVQVQNDGEVNVSSDGATWTLDINSGDIGAGAQSNTSGMDYSPSLDQLVWVGNGGIFSSEDGGASWTNRNLNDMQDVVWSEALGRWIACNDANPRGLFSADGINWSEGVPGTETWVSIALGDVL